MAKVIDRLNNVVNAFEIETPLTVVLATDSATWVSASSTVNVLPVPTLTTAFAAVWPGQTLRAYQGNRRQILGIVYFWRFISRGNTGHTHTMQTAWFYHPPTIPPEMREQHRRDRWKVGRLFADSDRFVRRQRTAILW